MIKVVFNEFYKLVDEGLLTYDSLTYNNMDYNDIKLLTERVIGCSSDQSKEKDVERVIFDTFGREDDIFLW